MFKKQFHFIEHFGDVLVEAFHLVGTEKYSSNDKVVETKPEIMDDDF